MSRFYIGVNFIQQAQSKMLISVILQVWTKAHYSKGGTHGWILKFRIFQNAHEQAN